MPTILRILVLSTTIYMVKCFGTGFYDYIRTDFLEPCGDNSNDTFIFDIQVKKDGRGKSVSGTWKLGRPLADDIAYHTAVYEKNSNNEYKLRMERNEENLCKGVSQTVPDLGPLLAKALSIPEGSRCPLKEGNYSMNKFPSTFKLKKFTMLPYGSYMLQFTLTLNGTYIVCHRFYATIVQ